jgi:pimeloyl-ACP methyl ester carboxylesterase
VLFLHGADSNALEWRHVMRSLEKDYDCCALDWWSGGFTEREQITTMLQKQDQPQPWLPVREHIRAFWEQEIAEPVILVGTSLGGAVALDFAAAHPEAVRALVLVDAGGQSYKARGNFGFNFLKFQK